MSLVKNHCGSINEAGFINSLKRKGFSDARSICELIANSIDAKCKYVKFVINDHEIHMIDNGSGMTNENIRNMWDAQRQNHENDESTGVSGLGSKPATLKLSGEKEVIIYTKSINDIYLKAIIPWNEIISNKKYIGVINIIDMNESEIEYFKKYLDNTGTIIKFMYNASFDKELLKQFSNPQTQDRQLIRRLPW